MANLTFENAQKLNDKEYLITLTGAELVDMWRNKDITYDPEIQRGVKISRDEEGNVLEQPVYSKANVKKIKKTIEGNDFFVSQLTLNAKEGVGTLEYDEDNKILSISEGEVSISDGQHRIRAMEEVEENNENDKYEEKIDLTKLVFPIKVTNYNTEKAQEQFYQFTLGSKISSSRSEYFNHKDYSNIITKFLYDNSVLSGKIETVKNIIGKNEDKIVSYATLKNAIEMNFETEKIVSKEEAMEVATYLSDFFKELFEVIPAFYSFEDRKAFKEDGSLICENFTFYGYLSVAAYIKDKENWKEILQLLSGVDFAKDHTPWVNRVTNKVVQKKKSKTEGENKVVKYNIINNSKSRKEMSVLLLKVVKKIERETFNEVAATEMDEPTYVPIEEEEIHYSEEV